MLILLFSPPDVATTILLCLDEIGYCRSTILVESFKICPFVVGVFQLLECLQSSSTSWHLSESLSFLELKKIPLCVILYLAYPWICQWALDL